MEKKTPAYNLEGFRQEFSSIRALRMTRTAQDCALCLGFDRGDVVEIVQSMRRSHFYKSMTAIGNHRIWHDACTTCPGPTSFCTLS